jgi:hypothetical protein
MQKAFIETQFPIARLGRSLQETQGKQWPDLDTPWEMVGTKDSYLGSGLYPRDVDAGI